MSPRWTSLWPQVWSTGDRSGADLGLTWLTRLSPDCLWPRLWEAPWTAGHHPDVLARLALDWLDVNTPERQSWLRVWRILRGLPVAGADAPAPKPLA